jgi:hypothetical protein
MPSFADALCGDDDAETNETSHRDCADFHWLIAAMGSVGGFFQFIQPMMPVHKL